MKTTRRTIGSRKALLFEPSKGNGKRRDHRIFVYLQTGNVTRVAFPQEPTIAVGIENPSVRAKLARALKKAGCQVIVFEDGLAMLEYFGDIMLLGPQEIVPDLVIVDASLKGRKGVDLLVDLRYVDWKIPFVLLTGKDDEKLRAEARRLQMVLGDLVVFEGKYDVDDLLTAIFFLLDRTKGRSQGPPVPVAFSA